MIRKTADKLLFRNGQKRNSPQWAFMEGFRVPHYDDPSIDYLWRLRLIATPWFGIFLHKLCTADPRDTLHDHPWSFLSVVLKGGYTEYVPPDLPALTGSAFQEDAVYAVPKKVRFFNLKTLKNSFHWIAELDKTPTWTLVFVGRRRNVWGYLERDGKFTEFDVHPFNDDFQKALEARYGGGDMV